MNPAFSVIFFTTASGAGYGLLFLTAIANALGFIPSSGWFAVMTLGPATALIVSGLLASTFHLGHPERAWRALSQWRSSWLSREGIAAVLTFVPLAIFGVAWAFFGRTQGWYAIAGLAAAAGAVVTVFTTAMIYRSLRTIRRWHNRWVVPNYLAHALSTGAVLLHAAAQAWGEPQAVVAVVAFAAVAFAAYVKDRYWKFIDTTKSGSTPETATGLGARGKVRLLDPPHATENYLQQEMGYKLARKHSEKLRTMVRWFAFGFPAAFTATAPVFAGSLLGAALSLLAVIFAIGGTLIERWLFFAEAKHAVTLYYGAREA
ncbi:MAG: dimethyl sulfoxide reductase anchor subunit [Alphaproteobacteria bacterium]|nr:dimethyl sulfoxide reductase anchor subunit [Alphaproteobacteria bacterium]